MITIPKLCRVALAYDAGPDFLILATAGGFASRTNEPHRQPTASWRKPHEAVQRIIETQPSQRQASLLMVTSWLRCRTAGLVCLLRISTRTNTTFEAGYERSRCFERTTCTGHRWRSGDRRCHG